MATRMSQEEKNMIMNGDAQIIRNIDKNIAGMSQQEMGGKQLWR